MCIRDRLRKVLGETPLLFTFRTVKEGGEKQAAADIYVDLNIKTIETGYADLVDVEIFTGDEAVKRVVKTAHGRGVKVIASNHDFQKTPEKEEIVSRLCRMQELGADIPKIAVMPRNKKDVLTLLAVSYTHLDVYKRQILESSEGGYTSYILQTAGGSLFADCLLYTSRCV